MAKSSESFRLLVPELCDDARACRTTRNLRFIAISLGAVAAGISVIIGAHSYRASYQLQLDAMVRTNITLARHLANADYVDSQFVGDADPPAWIVDHWSQIPRNDPEMFVCVVSHDGKLLVHSKRPERVGHDVSRMVLPATSTSPAKTVGELVAERGEWFGESRDSFGVRQLLAFEYSPALDGLVVVHTPASAYVARARRATLPWVIGFAVSTLLMWPLGLLLMNLAYNRTRRRADSTEQARKHSEHLFETIFDQAAIGVALIHTESGRFERINGKYESLIGFTNKEIKAKTWQEITHPHDLQPDIERMELLKTGQLSEFDLQKRLIRGDGAIIWVNFLVSPTWHPGESGKYHIAIIEDITERRQAALSLAESEQRFRTLVENAPEAIVVFDVDQQRFVDFNDNALRMFRVSREEMANSTPVDLSPAAQPDGRSSSVAAQALIARALAGEAPIQEWTHCDRQGVEISSEVRLVRLPATGRKLVRGSITDISERKRAEAKLRHQQAELAHVSRLSVMGEMVAGIAHEINQPLFAITNYAHTCSRVLSQEDLNQPDVLEWCAEIEREATRSGEIIRRLRNFTRKCEQPQRPVDANEAVQETMALLTLDSRQHHITPRAELTDEPVMIQGDLVGLQQVLVNLIRNAYEALAEAEVEHGMVTVTTDQCGPYVEIAVRDNGRGFANSDMDKIFDTFYSTKTEGMGMGLAISRTLVEAHGGTLTATNAAEGGAILRVMLPRLEGAIPRDVDCSIA